MPRIGASRGGASKPTPQRKPARTVFSNPFSSPVRTVQGKGVEKYRAPKRQTRKFTDGTTLGPRNTPQFRSAYKFLATPQGRRLISRQLSGLKPEDRLDAYRWAASNPNLPGADATLRHLWGKEWRGVSGPYTLKRGIENLNNLDTFTPNHKSVFEHAVDASRRAGGRAYDLGVEGASRLPGIFGESARAEKEGVPNIATALNPASSNPGFGKNLVKDAASFYPQVGLAAYQIGKDVVDETKKTGNPLQGIAHAVKKDVYEPIKETVTNPVESFNEAPVTTAFILKGAAQVPGRAAGMAMRSGALGSRASELASRGRAYVEVDPTTGQLVKRRYSPDVFVKAAQVKMDKARFERVAQDEVARNPKTGREVEADRIVRLRSRAPDDRSFRGGMREMAIAAERGQLNNDKFGARIRRADQRSNANDAIKREERALAQTAVKQLFGREITEGLRVVLGPNAKVRLPSGGGAHRVAEGKETLPANSRIAGNKAYLPDGSILTGIVDFKPPRWTRLAGQRAANLATRSVTHLTKKEERNLLGAVADRNVITPGGKKGLSGPRAYVEQLQKELDRLDDASMTLSGDELASNRVAAQSVREALDKAKKGRLDTSFIFDASRRYSSLRNVEEARAVDAGILDRDIARRRRVIPAAQQHGLVDFDPGGMLSEQALSARSAKKSVKAAKKDLKAAKKRLASAMSLEASKGRTALNDERIAGARRETFAIAERRRMLRSAKTAKYDAEVKRIEKRLAKAREEYQYALGRTRYAEGAKNRRLLSQIKAQATKLSKSSNPFEREYALEVLEAITKPETAAKPLGQLVSEAAGELAGGKNRGNKEFLPSGRVIQVNPRVGYLRDKLADMHGSGFTKDLSERYARVLGITAELKKAKRDADAAYVKAVEDAKAAGAERVASARKETAVRMSRARIAQASGMAEAEMVHGRIVRDAEKAVEAAREKASELARYRNERMPQRFVEKGKEGTNALEVATKDIENLLVEAGVDLDTLGFVPHRAGDVRKGDYYKKDTANRTETLMGDFYTGRSWKTGGYDASILATEARLVSQALTRSVMNTMADMIREIGVPSKTNEGNLQLFTTDTAKKRIEQVKRDGGPDLIAVRAFRASDRKMSKKLSESLENAKEGISVGNVFEEALGIKISREPSKLRPNEGFSVEGLDLNDVSIRKKLGQTPNIYLVDADAMGRILRQADLQLIFPGIGAAFRRTVLPFSPRWLGGNVVEAVLRSGIAGVTPAHARAYANVLTRLMLRDEQWAQQYRVNTEGGLMAGSQLNMEIKTDRTLQIERNKALNAVRQVVVKPTDAMFRFNKAFEDAFQRAAAGKQAVGSMQDFTNSWGKAIRAQKEAVEVLLESFDKNPAKAYAFFDDAARYTNDTLGKYNQFSPGMRLAIQGYAPFMAWYINCLRLFAYTLPVKHPVLTAMIAASVKAIDQDLKDQTKDAPSKALTFGVPLGDKKILDVARITPIGVAAEPAKVLSKEFVPVISGPYQIMQGRSPINPRMPLRDEQGNELKGEGVLAFLAANAFLESVVPYMGLSRRLATPSRVQADTSTWFTAPFKGFPLKKNARPRNPFVQFLSPVPIVGYGGKQSAGKASGPMDAYKKILSGSTKSSGMSEYNRILNGR